MSKTVKEILDIIPEELRDTLRIDVDEDENEFAINGLETIIIVRNPIDITMYESKDGEKLYTIKTKNGGEFVLSDNGNTFATIV